MTLDKFDMFCTLHNRIAHNLIPNTISKLKESYAKFITLTAIMA
jgi:hypothetical protein